MAHHYSGPDFSFPHGDARVDHTDLFAFPAPQHTARSVLVIDVHPSFGINPPGPTTTEPFAPEAIYELKVDTNGDGIADVAFRTRFSAADGAQSATVLRVEGPDAAGIGESGDAVVSDAPVSTGQEAHVTDSGDYRFFAGWRSDPFFFDAEGVLNDFQFTGNDFFVDKDVCSIAFELPNEALGASGSGRALAPDPRARRQRRRRMGSGRSRREAFAVRLLLPRRRKGRVPRRRAGDRRALRRQLRSRPRALGRVLAGRREARGRDAAARRPARTTRRSRPSIPRTAAR